MLIIVLGLAIVLLLDSLTSKLKICEEGSNCFILAIEKLFS